jgi:hypothetical protein
MPSRDSLGSVDPDDVQVAEVDTLLVHQGRTGAALGPAGPPGRARRGLVSFALSPGAELTSRCHCGGKEQAGQWGMSPQTPGDTLITVFMLDLA